MIKIPQYISDVLNILYENGYEGYLVGGCVRDALMGIEPHDFDITTNALPDEMISCFSHMRLIETGLKHGTLTVVSDGENVEITTYRIDGKYLDNRHPDKVLFTKNIHEDLSRRDFTVNAIAYSPKDGMVDIFGGADDISIKCIRCVGEPDKRFGEDGLRIIRALRFSAVLGFDIDTDTADSIHRNKNLLENISSERIYSELKKLLCGDNAGDILNKYSDVFLTVFPLIQKYKSIYFQNISDYQKHSVDVICRFAALFNNIPIDDVKQSLSVLKPDKYLFINVIVLLDSIHNDIGSDDISLKYLMNKLSDENIMRLFNLKKVLYPKFDYDEFINVYNRLTERNECVRISQLDISGTDLQNLGIKKGPEIGKMLNILLKEVIENHIINTREELIRFICEYTL